MENAFATALKNSTYRKEHDKERKLQTAQCLEKLEQGDKVLVRNLTPRGGPWKLRPYWESEIAEVISRFKNDVAYEVKFKSCLNKTRVLHRNMLMPINHLLDTIGSLPTISPMKSKISPERRIKLYKQGAEDPGKTSSSDESDSEFKLKFTPNQLLHLN